MLSFGTVWKLNPGWLTWRREQHNEGRESGGKGAQKYGRRENVHGKRETLTPLSPPTIFTKSQPSIKPQSPLVIWTFQGFQLLPSSLSILLLNVYQQSFLQTEGYCRPLEPQCDFFLEHSFSDLKNICLQFGCNLLNDSEIIQENWVCDLIVLTIKSQTQFSWR